MTMIRRASWTSVPAYSSAEFLTGSAVRSMVLERPEDQIDRVFTVELDFSVRVLAPALCVRASLDRLSLRALIRSRHCQSRAAPDGPWVHDPCRGVGRTASGSATNSATIEGLAISVGQPVGEAAPTSSMTSFFEARPPAPGEFQNRAMVRQLQRKRPRYSPFAYPGSRAPGIASSAQLATHLSGSER